METNYNNQIVKNISELFFYESNLKSEWLPIDIDFIKCNQEVLKKIKLEDFIIYNLNNFPEVYNHRLLLSISNDLLNLNKDDWLKVIKELNNSLSINSFLSFLNIYLKIAPETVVSYVSIKDFSYYKLESYNIDEDDLAYIEKYSLNEPITLLKKKLSEEIFPYKKSSTD